MPMYYFDYRHDGTVARDDIGSPMRSFDVAETEAVRALTELAKDELQKPLGRRLAIEVREGHVPVLEVVMTVEVNQLV